MPDRQRIVSEPDAAVKDLRDAPVPREEVDRVPAGYAQQGEDQQRQIHEIRTELRGYEGGNNTNRLAGSVVDATDLQAW